jgi:hypothetical protein
MDTTVELDPAEVHRIHTAFYCLRSLLVHLIHIYTGSMIRGIKAAHNGRP